MHRDTSSLHRPQHDFGLLTGWVSGVMAGVCASSWMPPWPLLAKRDTVFTFYLVFVRFDFIPLFRNRAQAVTGIGQQNRSTDFQPLWRGGFCMVFHCLRNAHCMALRITENVPKQSTAFLRQPWPIEELCRSSPQCTIFVTFVIALKQSEKKWSFGIALAKTTSGGLCFGRLELWRSHTKFDVVGIFVCSDSWFFGARSKGLEIKLISDSFPTFPRLDIWWTSTMVVSFHGLRALTWNHKISRWPESIHAFWLALGLFRQGQARECSGVLCAEICFSRCCTAVWMVTGL